MKIRRLPALFLIVLTTLLTVGVMVSFADAPTTHSRASVVPFQTEEVDDTDADEEVTATGEMTGTTEVTGTEGVSGTTDITGTTGISDTDGISGTDDISGTTGITGTETVTPTPPPPPPPPENPWYGTYFDNPTFSGRPIMTTQEHNVNHWWALGSPDERMGFDWFSVRWQHTLRTPGQGFYQVQAASDYGMRLDVNGARILDQIRNGNASPVTTFFFLGDSQNANMRYDYFHHEGNARAYIDVTKMITGSAPFGKATVAGGSPVLRDGPGIDYYSNGRLSEGSVVTLTGHRNLPSNWVCVVDENGVTGWVNTFYLQTGVAFDSLQLWPFYVPDSLNQKATVSRDHEFINLRYNPEQNSSFIAQVNGGSQVDLVGKSSSGNWILVRMWEGTMGWAPRGTLESFHNLDNLPVRRVDTTGDTTVE